VTSTTPTSQRVDALARARPTTRARAHAAATLARVPRPRLRASSRRVGRRAALERAPTEGSTPTATRATRDDDAARAATTRERR